MCSIFQYTHTILHLSSAPYIFMCLWIGLSSVHREPFSLRASTQLDKADANAAQRSISLAFLSNLWKCEENFPLFDERKKSDSKMCTAFDQTPCASIYMNMHYAVFGFSATASFWNEYQIVRYKMRAEQNTIWPMDTKPTLFNGPIHIQNWKDSGKTFPMNEKNSRTRPYVTGSANVHKLHIQELEMCARCCWLLCVCARFLVCKMQKRELHTISPTLWWSLFLERSAFLSYMV